MHFKLKLIALILVGGMVVTDSAQAAEEGANIRVIAEQPEFYKLVDKDARAGLITDRLAWSEGPVCSVQDVLIFSDVKRNKVMSWSERQGVKIWLDPSDYQNGHAIDAEGRIIAASQGKRALLRQERDGSWVTLADSWQGKRLNSPNDVVVASDGAIWFTDPTFGLLSKDESYGGEPEQDGEFVYRYDPTTEALSKVNTPEVHSPNGLAFSPDGRLFYVSDTQLAHDFSNQSLAHRIMVYDVSAHGTENGRVFAEVSPGIPDGIKVDERGNVWSSSKEGIQVFSPAGKLLGKIIVPSKGTGNLALCMDSDNKNWLYITAANLVLRVPVLVKGVNLIPSSPPSAEK